MRKLLSVLMVLVVAVGSMGMACSEGSNQAEQARRDMSQKVGEMISEANRQVAMPAIDDYTEREMVKTIMEMRDNAVSTHSYFFDERGRIHKLCNSIGFGVPYSTQMTNPSKIADAGHNYGYAILPQAEPNGLFMPNNVDGTWVACQNPRDSTEIAPVYSEPELIVSPFPLEHSGSY